MLFAKLRKGRFNSGRRFVMSNPVRGPMLQVIGLIAILALAFQNCGPVQFGRFSFTQTKSTAELAFELNHNGDGYHGKLTFVHLDHDNTCTNAGANAANQAIERAIEVSAGQYHLVIDNCQQISPRPLAVGDIQLSQLDQTILIYQEQIFIAESHSPVTPNSQVLAYCSAQNIPYTEILDIEVLLSQDILTREYFMSYRLTASDIFSGVQLEVRERQNSSAVSRTITGNSSADEYVLMSPLQPTVEEFKLTVNATGSTYPDPETFSSFSQNGGRDYSSSALTCIWE